MTAGERGAGEPMWTGTYAEAKLRFEKLGQEIEKIQGQLTAWKPTVRVSQEDFDRYRQWHARAIGAREGMRRQREALKDWMRANLPEPPKKEPNFKHQLAARLDEMGIDYTPGELENLRRRLLAEQVIQARAILIVDLVEMFREHGPCEPDCAACALLDRAEREVA